VNRIKELIESEGLSSSQFADAIEVPRAVLSHVLSGRNKPSLDVMLKVLARYKKISPEWLLLGEGEMLKTIAAVPAPAAPAMPVPAIVEEHAPGEQQGMGQLKEVQKDGLPADAIVAGLASGKQVRQIVIFYTDNTCAVFNPEA
ncbi:MAG TPA: helix-turn-helix transcriptional regulator, partial [Pontibacter sp.]